MNNAFLDVPNDALSVANAIIECIKANRIDDAQSLLAELHVLCPGTRDIPAIDVLIALRAERPLDAWQVVNGLPDDRCPDLKALCLKMLRDPAWYGYAIAHEDSPNVHVRRMMRQLLGKPIDTDD